MKNYYSIFLLFVLFHYSCDLHTQNFNEDDLADDGDFYQYNLQILLSTKFYKSGVILNQLILDRYNEIEKKKPLPNSVCDLDLNDFSDIENAPDYLKNVCQRLTHLNNLYEKYGREFVIENQSKASEIFRKKGLLKKIQSDLIFNTYKID